MPSRRRQSIDPREPSTAVNSITAAIVDEALRIHVELGPGLLESVYEVILAHSVVERGLTVNRQVLIPLVYDEMTFDQAFRADLLVEDCVIVEIKSVECLTNAHRKQLLTYLKLADKRAGLLLNFAEALMKNGIVRSVNGLHDD